MRGQQKLPFALEEDQVGVEVGVGPTDQDSIRSRSRDDRPRILLPEQSGVVFSGGIELVDVEETEVSAIGREHEPATVSPRAGLMDPVGCRRKGAHRPCRVGRTTLPEEQLPVFVAPSVDGEDQVRALGSREETTDVRAPGRCRPRGPRRARTPTPEGFLRDWKQSRATSHRPRSSARPT